MVFFDGKFIKQEEAMVPVNTHALHYGTGCFEGIRAYYSEKEKALFAFRMRDHYQRFLLSAKVIFVNIPYSVDELCKITTELIAKNFAETDLYIRPLAFKSDRAVGNFNLKTLKDSLVIYTIPMGRHYGDKEGIRATISPWTRISGNAIPPRAKVTGAYVNTSLAKTESTLSGYDEALFVNSRGHIVEGTAENIFIVKNGTVLTPPASDDILEGITRDTVIKLCRDELKLNVIERSVDRTDAYQADEMLLTGTGAEISPVIEIDGRVIGSGVIGPVGEKVKDLYSRVVHGEYPKYGEFLTKILPA